MFDVYENAVLFSFGEKFEVVGEGLDGRFGYENVDFSFDCVESNGIVSGVWSEDCNCRTRCESINCGFVGICVPGVVCGIGFE
jgi:hypothetical protein